MFSLGFSNGNGSAPQWHQIIPVEYAKIYHSLIESPGMSDTIKRMTRDDLFVLQHDPYHQFGEFDFAIKQDVAIKPNTTVSGNNWSRSVPAGLPTGFNEVAMYWVQSKLGSM